MNISTTRSKVVSASAAFVVAAAAVVGATAVGSDGTVPDPNRKVPTIEAPAYVGDPWEKRYREQFWSEQHVHDSWNRCHIGENVPQRIQQGSGC